MCGILVHFKQNSLDNNDVENAFSSLASINHRGPNGEGLCLINTENGAFEFIKTNQSHGVGRPLSELKPSDYNLILGHKRLSIFDLSVAGAQPMLCPKTKRLIIFNGEIYNWHELKVELVAKGYTFQTQTDTEVVLAAYDYWGDNCLSRFNGMFSIVIFDSVKKSLFIVRDRFGVKPLYHTSDLNQFVFASEIKQFLYYKNLIGKYNTSLIQFFLDEGVTNFNEETFFTNLFSFKASHYSYLSKSSFKLNQTSYFTLTDRISNLNYSDTLKQYQFLINDAVKLRLRADVPVGIAVSGGLDSSSIFCLAYDQLREFDKHNLLNTFSVISPGNNSDESEHIHAILNHFKCNNHFVSLLDEFSVENFRQQQLNLDFPVLSGSFFADYCLSKQTALSNVKVLLNGQGADEVFAGYHHHFYKYLSSLLKNFKFSEYYKQLTDFSKIKSRSKSELNKIAFNNVKSQLFKRGATKYKIGTLRERWINSNSLQQQLTMDIRHFSLPIYLSNNDNNTMAFSIESRHPFMDYRLVEFGLSLPDEYKIKNGFQKYIMRDAMKNIPDSIKWRKDKKGFTVPEDKVLYSLNQANVLNPAQFTDMGLKFDSTIRHHSLSMWLSRYTI